MPLTVVELFTIDKNAATIWENQPHQHSHGRAFSRTILPKEAVNITFLNGERKAINRLELFK